MNTSPSDTARGSQSAAQLLGPLLQAGFVKAARPVRRDGILGVHAANLTIESANAIVVACPVYAAYIGWEPRRL